MATRFRWNSREYRDKEAIFSQGDAADAVYYMQSGKVKRTVVSKRSKEAVVAILAEASFFGEGCPLGQAVSMSTATAVQRATVIRVEKPVMLNLLHQEPGFAERFLAYCFLPAKNGSLTYLAASRYPFWLSRQVSISFSSTSR